MKIRVIRVFFLDSFLFFLKKPMPISAEIKKSIFNKLKSGLEKCTPPMKNSKNKEGVYELMGNKPVPYGYKKEMVPGMYFSSVVTRKDSIDFYFFPLYMNFDAFKESAPALLKCLKGKTCFHFKKEEQVNEKELAALLKKGVQVWKKMGYMAP